MIEFQIVKFHPKHFECMDIRQKEKDAIFSLPDAYARYEHVAEASLQAATFIGDGRVLFCAGFFLLWSGVAEFWMIPSAHVGKYPMPFYRTIRQYLKEIPATFKLHRIQTTSYDDAFHEKWMRKLKFKKEGTMEQYRHDKSNMCIYGRTF